MAGNFSAVQVRGLRELNAALGKVSIDTRKELSEELRVVSEPVRSRAEQLASAGIRNIGPRWRQMRVGVTTKVAYVAPRAHRRGGSARPNLAQLLMDRAMQPALDENEGKIVARIGVMFDLIARRNGF